MSRSDRHTGHEEAEFLGYERNDGRMGIRNRVLVLPSVICSHLVAESIAERVDRAIATPHDHGCAQLGVDAKQTRTAFVGTARNPNVAGVLVVGLGCEEVQSDDVAAAIDDRPVREIAIQDAGGTEACIDAGVAAATELAQDAETAAASRGTLGDLTVGVVVSDVAESTVEHVHPLVGSLLDEVVAAGGRAIVAGNERFVTHSDAVRARTSPSAESAIADLLARHEGQPARASGVARRVARTDADQALGFLGDQPVREVLGYGKRATIESGVAIVDAPSRFAEAATGLAAAGANVIVHATAEGVPAGHPVVPVLKLSAEGATLAALPEDIDADARETTPAELRDRLLRIADGTNTCAEGHGLTEFAITRVGPSM